MAGQANGGQVVSPSGVNPMDQGRYVGNPNHSTGGSLGQPTFDKKGSLEQQAVPEYMKGFKGLNGQLGKETY